MQIKTSIKYHYTFVRMAKINSDISNAGKDVEKLNHSYCRWECKMVTSPWKTAWQLL